MNKIALENASVIVNALKLQWKNVNLFGIDKTVSWKSFIYFELPKTTSKKNDNFS